MNLSRNMHRQRILAATLTLFPITLTLVVSSWLPLPISQSLGIAIPVDKTTFTAFNDTLLSRLDPVFQVDMTNLPDTKEIPQDDLQETPASAPTRLTFTPTNCSGSLRISRPAQSLTHREALAEMDAWRNLHAPKPMIVGGIGDSGTRGVYSLLSSFGVFLGRGAAINGHTKDSNLFVSRFNLTLDDGSVDDFGLSGFVNPMLKAAGSLAYCKESLQDDEKWYNGVRHMLHVMQLVYRHAQLRAPNTFRKNHRVVHFGFKHPRSVLVLPWLSAALENEFKFILVVRDGREVATGGNRRFYHDICRLYHRGKKTECRSALRYRLSFWAAVNVEVIDWMKENGRNNQYLIVRAEDLVNNQTECLERVADFAGVSEERKARAQSLARKYMAFAPSYNGNKLSMGERKQLDNIIETLPEVKAALFRLGYETNASMGVRTSCTSLDLDLI